MARTKKKVAGIGAVCDCLCCFLHPGKVIDKHFVNTHHNHRIDYLVIVKREVCMVNKKEQMCCFYNHSTFPDRLIHSIVRYAKVLQEGDPSGYFAENFPTAGTDLVAIEVVGEEGEGSVTQPTLTR